MHREFTRRGHSVEVFCPDLAKNGRFNEQGIWVNRVNNRWIKSFDSNFSRLAILRELRNAVQRRADDFDVFIAPEYNIGPLSLSLTRGTKKIGIYGADFVFEFVNIKRREPASYAGILDAPARTLGFVGALKVKVLYALQHFITRRLDQTIVLNQMDEGRLRKISANVRNVPCFIEPNAALPAGKPVRTPKLITVIGRAVSWKRIPQSFELALDIQKRFSGSEIHYFGSGPDLKNLESRFAQQIIFHKEAPNSEVLQWLERSDITVNLSDYETFCLVNTEAMLRGSLLVVNPLPEYDYLRDRQNCVFAPPEKRGSIPEEIERLFQSDGAAEMIAQARADVLTLYDLDRTAARLEALLREVAGVP